MSTERRLAKVEASLSPTQLVVRWLDEAHGFGSLEAYAAALLDEPPARQPLDRLLHEAVAGVRGANPRLRHEALDTVIRTALRETAFRFKLVLRIVTVSQALLDREVLLEALIAAHLALVASRAPRKGRASEDHLGQLRSIVQLATGRHLELRAAAEARATVEARYLGGHSALFPDGRAAFAVQLARTGELTDLARRVAGPDVMPSADPEPVSRRAAELVVDLVEPARATALEELDEGRGAMTIATAWVRQKLVRGDPDAVRNAAL